MLGDLIEAKDETLKKLGIKVGKLYTDYGLPIDIAFGRLPHTKEQKLAILDGACQWFIEHKRNSGATKKAIERQRAQNRRMIESFIKSGEVGIY